MFVKNKVTIAIAREFGSGGHEIGLGLSQALGVDFYDKEILKQAAQESGIMQELFEKADEKPTNSFMYSLAVGTQVRSGAFSDYSDYLTNDKLFLLQSDAIKKLSEKSSCVIIGRCADYILQGTKGLLKVYIHSPLELRVQRIAKIHNIDEDAARALIKKTDKSRANYYSFYTDTRWGNAANYDLCVDAGKFGVNGAINIIKNACEHL